MYQVIYYNSVTESEKAFSVRNCLLFGVFSRKSDAIKSVKKRFGVDPLVKSCISAEVVRSSDGKTVFSMEV